MGRKIVKSILVGNIQRVIENKINRQSYLFTYQPNGNNYYLVNGEKVSIEKFNELFPIEFKPYSSNTENPDKTKNWIQDKKSY
jgi:hypothetical protein